MELLQRFFEAAGAALSYIIVYFAGVASTLYFERRLEKWSERIKVAVVTAFAIKPSTSGNIGDTVDLVVTVTNCSEKTLEPFRLWLMHPDFGSRSVFHREHDDPLAPGQRVSFVFHITKNGRLTDNFLAISSDKQWFEIEARNVAFQLVTDRTDRQLIFESHRLGRTFVKALSIFWTTKSANISGELLGEMRSNPQNTAEWFRDKCVRRKMPRCEE